MARIRYEKWSYWIPQVGVLFCLFAVITAQPGFLSINCGGKTNHTGANNITWVTDANYIDVGETSDIGNITQQAFGSSLYSIRFFPKPLNKSCYQLSVPSNVPYLLRLWFIRNYNGFQTLPSFAYSFETVDMLAMNNITLTDNGFYDERIFVTSGTVMYVCLIKTFESDDPFISGIELRPLRDGMYAQAMPGKVLILDLRIDVGGKSVVRYPLDIFDRIWTTNISLDYGNASLFRSVSSEESISMNNTEDLPPSAVMQTAWVQNGVYLFSVSFGSAQWNKSLLLLYFTEVETIDMSEDRSFNVEINWKILPEPITPPRNYSALELIFVSDQLDSFALTPTVNATQLPLVNAFEHYWLLDTQPPTYLQDIEALDAIKMSFDIKDWISDPCYLIHWKGISCDNSSSAIRISEIDLPGRNLTGSLPKEIEQLTALVNVSLNNNYLMGPFPNFSNLTMLERLYLQNNNMNGTVPEWLSQLKNLKELSLNNNYLTGPLPNFSNLTMLERMNIENNNFRDVIPAQLLHNCSLKFKYYNTQKLTEKSDVYSFGVVLLEIICGRQPIDVNLPEDEVNIIRWVTPYVLDMEENPGRIAEIIDKRLDGSYDLKSITCVAKVAMRCVQSAPSLRPSVTKVVRELEKAMKIEYKVSISHDIGIKSSDLLVGSLSLSMDSRGRKGMEWRDNSSNISKVGR